MTLAQNRHRSLTALVAFSFSIGLAAGLMPSSNIVRACSCAYHPPLERLARADAVFHGRVTRMQWVETTDPDLPGAVVTFKVLDRWKGPEGPTFTLHTAGVSTFLRFSRFDRRPIHGVRER